MKSVLSLCKGLPRKTFQPGEILMNEGQRSNRIYVLINGAVNIYKSDVLVSSQFEPGSIYGEMSVLLDVMHTATVKADGVTETYEVTEAKQFLRSHPDITYQLAALLARKLNSITSYLADLKMQYEGHDHLSMVDEVLESLLNEQVEDFEPGSDRYPDDTIE